MKSDNLDDLTLDRAIDMIRTLRAERDNARREVCRRTVVELRLRGIDLDHTVEAEASERGWGYLFKEDGK